MSSVPNGVASKGTSYPAHFSLQGLIRPNILALQPYRCARDDYQSGILLDANENSLGHSLPPSETESSLPYDDLSLNRYPDPVHTDIKQSIAQFRSIPSPDFVFLGVGSDEVIDLLIRISCVPARDKILITPPTYGMYSVCANVNDVGIVKVPLTAEGGAFQLQVDEIRKTVAADPNIKLIFICSPGNPTGTLIPIPDIRSLLDFPDFHGLVVVDEAYIDFSGPEATAAQLVSQYANLCVMQTLSKSFGLAAIRLGIALAQPPLIQLLSNTKAPYNISALTAHVAKDALSPEGIALMKDKVSTLILLREEMKASLATLQPLGVGAPLGTGHANFLLVPILRKGSTSNQDFDNVRSEKVYKLLAEERGIVVRFRGREPGCGGCLRITIGTPEENKELLERLKETLPQV